MYILKSCRKCLCLRQEQRRISRISPSDMPLPLAGNIILYYTLLLLPIVPPSSRNVIVLDCHELMCLLNRSQEQYGKGCPVMEHERNKTGHTSSMNSFNDVAKRSTLLYSTLLYSTLLYSSTVDGPFPNENSCIPYPPQKVQTEKARFL